MSKIAYVFPGQGSQSVGMLQELYEVAPSMKDTFNEASEALGFDLWEIVQNNPEDKLNQTEITQPAILTASVALYRLLENNQPSVMAGHSLGEYSALVCAGSIAFSDAVKLVHLRGQAMQRAVPAGEGAMAAVIGLDDALVKQACDESAQGAIVAPVNFNSPGQVVIAGQVDAVARASEACKAFGAKRVLPLPVSVPSHCALMKPAADELAAALQPIEVKAPKVPVIHNSSVETTLQPEVIRQSLIEQLYQPVRWTESIQKMAAEGVQSCYEVGPGKVLTGLMKRIDKNLTCEALNTIESIQNFNKGETHE